MKHYLACFVLISISTTAFCQASIKEYVTKNASKISSISPKTINYSDLEPIGNAIGDARIVMLGEQDHRDGPGFIAKTMLVKYLHEKKGFNVLVFEGDLFAIENNWKLVLQGVLPLDSFTKKDLSRTHNACGSFNYLFATYVPLTLQSNHPLQIAGLDAKINTLDAVSAIDSFCKKMDLPITKTSSFNDSIIPLLRSWYKYVDDPLMKNRLVGYCNTIKQQMLATLSMNDLPVLWVENFAAYIPSINGRGDESYYERNIRDAQMARNLKWLAQIRYPKEKIIIWAHNTHISKYPGHFKEAFLNAYKSMGSNLAADSVLGNEIYSIGFTSKEGTSGRLPKEVHNDPPPKKDGFENWINKEYPYAFVDFKPFNVSNAHSVTTFPMKTHLQKFHLSQEAEWSKIFDGVFYIKETFSCEEDIKVQDFIETIGLQ